MYQYTVSVWVLFFFWYCFLGWIWESCYVSVLQAVKTGKGKWINRGFLRGPALPIYGSAAIVILVATIPVKENILHIFLFGALAATLLELVTGSTMEKLFHVKYWDYSNMPLNFQGHICFFVSLFWGALSVVLVRVVHVPVEGILLRWPKVLCEILAIVLVIVFVFDLNESIREAWDMRELLEKLTNYKDTVQRWERRFDAVIAFTPVPDIDELRGITGSAKEKILLRLEVSERKRVAGLNKLKESLRLDKLGEVRDKEEILKQLEDQIRGVLSRTNRQYLRVRKHLQRNPRAISKKYADALSEIKGLFQDEKKS